MTEHDDIPMPYDENILQAYANNIMKTLHASNENNSEEANRLMQALMKTITMIGYNNLIELISEYSYLQAPMNLLSDDKIIKWAEMNHDILIGINDDNADNSVLNDSNENKHETKIHNNANDDMEYTVNLNDYKYADDYVSMNDKIPFTEQTDALIKSLLLNDYVNDYMIMYTRDDFDYRNVLSVAVYDSDKTTGNNTNWVPMNDWKEYADRREWPWPLISEFIADNHNDHKMRSFLNSYDSPYNQNASKNNNTAKRSSNYGNSSNYFHNLINRQEHESMLELITYLSDGSYDALESWIDFMKAYENNSNSRIKTIMDMIQSKYSLTYSYEDMEKVLSFNDETNIRHEYMKPCGSEITDGFNVNEIAYNADRDYSDDDFNQVEQLISKYDNFYDNFLCNRSSNDNIMHAIINNPILIDFIELDDYCFKYISENNILYVTDDNGIKHVIGKGDNGNPDFHDYSGLDDSYNDAFAINHDNYNDAMNHVIRRMFANMKEGYPMEYVMQDAYNAINAYMNDVVNGK